MTNQILNDALNKPTELIVADNEAYGKEIQQLAEQIDNLPREKKLRLKTPDRKDILDLYLTAEDGRNVSTGIVLLMQSLHHILNHPKYTDSIEKSPEIVQEMHKIIAYQIMPAIFNNAAEMVKSTHFAIGRYTMNKTQNYIEGQTKGSLSYICKSLKDTLADYDLSIEEFYNLSPRKIIHLLNEIFILHMMPKWEEISNTAHNGDLEEYEIQFITRLKCVSDQFADDKQLAANAKHRKKANKLFKELYDPFK